MTSKRFVYLAVLINTIMNSLLVDDQQPQKRLFSFSGGGDARVLSAHAGSWRIKNNFFSVVVWGVLLSGGGGTRVLMALAISFLN